MKRSIATIVTLLFSISFVLLQMGQDVAHTKLTGSGNGGGNTGSPGDNGQTCADAFGCHTDNNPIPNSQDASISTDIPSGGYVPGNTYTITASITQNGHVRFGFELTAEDDGGNKVGSFASTDSETQLTNGSDAVTHTNSGISGTDSKSWSVEWTAPNANTGDVNFYGAFNVADNNNQPTGDQIHLDSTQVQEDTAASLIPSRDLMTGGSSLSLAPNPAKDRVRISGLSEEHGNGRILLRDLQGRVVEELYEGKLSRHQDGLMLDLEQDIPAGAYLMEVQGNEAHSVERILIE